MTGRTSRMDNGGEAAAPALTALLQAWSLGDASALERLTPIVYSELRRLAHSKWRASGPGMFSSHPPS